MKNRCPLAAHRGHHSCARRLRVSRRATVTSPDADLGALRTFRSCRMPSGDPRVRSRPTTRCRELGLNRACGPTSSRDSKTAATPSPTIRTLQSRTTQARRKSWTSRTGIMDTPTIGLVVGPGFRSLRSMVTQYTQGTVVVDVVNPRPGSSSGVDRASSRVSDDQQQYEQDLWKGGHAISTSSRRPVRARNPVGEGSVPRPRRGRATTRRAQGWMTQLIELRHPCRRAAHSARRSGSDDWRSLHDRPA